jgi:hypothetical protein
MVIVLAVALDAGQRIIRGVIHPLPWTSLQKRTIGVGAAVVIFPIALGAPAIEEILLTLRGPEPRFVSHMDSRVLVSYVRTLPDLPQAAISTTSYQVTAMLSGIEASHVEEYWLFDPDRHAKLVEVIQRENTGLLALDRERADWPGFISVPRADFVVSSEESLETCVRYDGQFGDFHLWTWGDALPRDCESAVRLAEWLAISG